MTKSPGPSAPVNAPVAPAASQASAGGENEIAIVRAFLNLLMPRERVQFGILSLLLLITGAFEMLGVGLVFVYVRYLADITAGKTFIIGGEMLNSFVEAHSAWAIALIGGVIFVAAFVAKALVILSVNFLLMRFIFNVLERVSCNIFSRYMDISLGYFATQNSGDVQRDINQLPQSIFNQSAVALVFIFTNVISIAFLSILLLAVDPVVTVIAIAVVLTVSGSFYLFFRGRLSARGRKRYVMAAAMFRWVTEALGGLKEIRIAGLEGSFVRQYRARIHNLARADRYLRVVGHIPSLVNELTVITGIVAVLLYFVSSGQNVADLLPVLAMFGVAGIRIVGMISSLVTNVHTLQYQGPALRRFSQKLLDLEAARYDDDFEEARDGRLDFSDGLTAEKIGFLYPTARAKALDEISLEIPKGSQVAFVGPTGSGKSTMVLLLTGLLDPSKGEIIVDGQALRGCRRAWFDQIAYVPQTIFLLDDTIRANVAFSPGVEGDEARIWQSLERAQLGDFVRGLPQGLDTPVGENGAQLSGGERQRLGIARALYRQTKVIFLDEATAALDNDTERRLLDTLTQDLPGVTLIMVAHRLTTVRRCDKIFYLENGRLKDQGSFDDLQARQAGFFGPGAEKSADSSQ